MTDYKQLDILGNRKAQKYTQRELFLRIVWRLIQPLFRYSPRTFFGWRSFILRLFGAKIGRDTHIYNSANIYMPWNLEIGAESSIGEWVLVYNLGVIAIGDRATISHTAHLCSGTHSYTDPALPLIKKSIVIRDMAWICAGAFVGPGVVVGEGAVVGACSVVTKDVSPWEVVAGNPAAFIKNRIIESEH